MPAPAGGAGANTRWETDTDEEKREKECVRSGAVDLRADPRRRRGLEGLAKLLAAQRGAVGHWLACGEREREREKHTKTEQQARRATPLEQEVLLQMTENDPYYFCAKLPAVAPGASGSGAMASADICCTMHGRRLRNRVRRRCYDDVQPYMYVACCDIIDLIRSIIPAALYSTLRNSAACCSGGHQSGSRQGARRDPELRGLCTEITGWPHALDTCCVVPLRACSHSASCPCFRVEVDLAKNARTLHVGRRPGERRRCSELLAYVDW